MARIGYARVSTTDQDLDIQIGRLKNAGCEIIRSETGSGASRSGRTELETIMQFMHTGDELVVLRLDRLGRSTRDVLNLVHELDEKGASLRILEPEVTTAGDLLLAMEVRQLHRLAADPRLNHLPRTLLGRWTVPVLPHLHDPYGLDDPYMATCLARIEQAVERLVSAFPRARLS